MLYGGKATMNLGRRPTCQMCENGTTPAAVDAKTRMGPWAYMCTNHHAEVGVGLGNGVGQVLLCNDRHDAALRTHYGLPSESAGVAVQPRDVEDDD